MQPESILLNALIRIQSCKYNLKFKFEAGTSRGILNDRDIWFIRILDQRNGIMGYGECAPLTGLSPDPYDGFDRHLDGVCRYLEEQISREGLPEESPQTDILYPSVAMGFETAFSDFKNGGRMKIFKNGFTEGRTEVGINGLIWMGDREFMSRQIEQKISEGYTCIKMKIGALDFETEFEVLSELRRSYPEEKITLRVDANGAFHPDLALGILERLAILGIHSIEQPVLPRYTEKLSELARISPVPIALDESLIGQSGNKAGLLDQLTPSYIVLKPTLLGGFRQTLEWIRLAEERNIGWWITSALESNIGLNAIAQFAAGFPAGTLHGLGTGQLFSNNISSPIGIRDGRIFYDSGKSWDTGRLNDLFG